MTPGPISAALAGAGVGFLGGLLGLGGAEFRLPLLVALFGYALRQAAGNVRLEPGTTKNRDGRTFILTPELRACLEAQQAVTDTLQKEQGKIIPWVFHRRKGMPFASFRKAWLTACKAAGTPGRIPRDFRRTAVRNLERAGVPRSVAMKMVGHKTESVYRRYAIVDESMLREGSERLSRLDDAGV